MGSLRVSGPALRPRALSIAGSDPSGGAGIQADLKTFSALGVYGMTAITAVTVQNTQGVSGFEAIDPATVSDQVRAVATDVGVDAAKTGMLANASIVEAVAEVVAEVGIRPLVVDPVSVSKHGHALLAPEAVASMRERIVPLATLVTPNLPEAAVLAGFPVQTREDMRRAAEAILHQGAGAVLIKGGHLLGAEDAADLFADGRTETWVSAPRIETPNTHGTGCTLSAAVAARLAIGDDLLAAVEAGKRFVTEAIRASLAIGRGIGPVDPLWSIPPGGTPS
jgi:hydroxymethylpyrimidine/phosphomethylpyrimidine kinase